MAKVTVAVPAFKIEEKYLRICLDSILQQTLHDIEVILIVDPVDEVCNRVCVEYAGQDDRIRLMQEKDEGYCVWRNYAIERASSKWLMYVDGDDYIAPDNCEIVYEKAEKTQPDILFWGATKVYEGTDRQVPYVSFHEDIEEFTPVLKELLQMKLLVGDMGFYPAISAKAATGVIWNKLYNREFLLREELRLNPQVDRAEDVVFNMNAFERADKIIFMNRCFYYYRQHAASGVHRYHEHGIDVFEGALREFRNFIVDYHKSEKFMQIYYMRCIFFFLDDMKIDFLHPDNPKSFGTKIREMKQIVAADPYLEAIRNIDLSLVSGAKKLPFILLKCHCIRLLYVFFSLYCKIE